MYKLKKEFEAVIWDRPRRHVLALKYWPQFLEYFETQYKKFYQDNWVSALVPNRHCKTLPFLLNPAEENIDDSLKGFILTYGNRYGLYTFRETASNILCLAIDRSFRLEYIEFLLNLFGNNTIRIVNSGYNPSVETQFSNFLFSREPFHKKLSEGANITPYYFDEVNKLLQRYLNRFLYEHPMRLFGLKNSKVRFFNMS